MNDDEYDRITDDWIYRVEEALSTKMFLVNEIGPTKLVFKDDTDQKMTISLSTNINCSLCNPKKSKKNKIRCKHALFCLIKVFKLDRKSDLLFKNPLSGENLNYILEGRFKQRKRVDKQKFNYLRRKHTPLVEQNKKEEYKAKRKENIDFSEPCPICYEPLIGEDLDEATEVSSLHSCQKCLNPFHIECLITWAKHKVSNCPSKKTQCPMCRSHWDKSPITTLHRMEQLQNKHRRKECLHSGTRCSGCDKKPIFGKMFMCVSCKNHKMCEKCFELGVHKQHSHYLVKEKVTDKWTPSLARFSPSAKNDLKMLTSVNQGGADLEGFNWASLGH